MNIPCIQHIPLHQIRSTRLDMQLPGMKIWNVCLYELELLWRVSVNQCGCHLLSHVLGVHHFIRHWIFDSIMSELTDVLINEWCSRLEDEINEWMNEWVDGWTNRWINERVDEWWDVLMNGWVNGWMGK